MIDDEYRVSFLFEENALKLDRGDGLNDCENTKVLPRVQMKEVNYSV